MVYSFKRKQDISTEKKDLQYYQKFIENIVQNLTNMI